MPRWARPPEPHLPVEWPDTMRWAHLPAEVRAHLGTELRALLERAATPRADLPGRVLVLGSVAAVAGFLVAGLSEYNVGDSEVALVVWTLMALPFAGGAEPPAPGGDCAMAPGEAGPVRGGP